MKKLLLLFLLLFVLGCADVALENDALNQSGKLAPQDAESAVFDLGKVPVITLGILCSRMEQATHQLRPQPKKRKKCFLVLRMRFREGRPCWIASGSAQRQ
jgi:hypothetical protein